MTIWLMFSKITTLCFHPQICYGREGYLNKSCRDGGGEHTHASICSGMRASTCACAHTHTPLTPLGQTLKLTSPSSVKIVSAFFGSNVFRIISLRWFSTIAWTSVTLTPVKLNQQSVWGNKITQNCVCVCVFVRERERGREGEREREKITQ